MSTITMGTNAQLSVRIDADVKAKAEALLAQLGMSPADYARVAFSQLVLRQGIPFDMRVPNAETQAALDEPIENRLSFASVEEMQAHLASLPDED